MSKKINGFKGFKKDMTCRGFQYEEGKTYTMDDEPECCEKGFHFCEYPLDCLHYYEARESVYHKVEATGKTDKGNNGDDTKIATNEIKIGARLSWRDIAEASIEFVMKHAKKGGKGANKRTDYSVSSNTGDNSVSSNTGYYSVSSNTGNYSVSSNTGNYSVSSNTGNYSVSSNTGNYSVSSNTGDNSVSSNTGYYSVSSNTGDNSVSSNTGYKSVSSNTGNYSVSSNTGYKSVSKNTGKNGIASSLGVYGRASGKIGTWLVLAEWIEKGWEHELKGVKTVKVDGKKIKEDTLYQLVDGKFVEVSE